MIRNKSKWTIFASGGLRCYEWYQSQTLDGVQARTLSPKGLNGEILH